MPRQNRAIVSREYGHNHIYSRIAGGAKIIGDQEKEFLFNLFTRYASGFFVTIHSLAIMSNHFHILVSEAGEEAQAATAEDLLARYRSIFGQDADPPHGRQGSNGETIPDPDGGKERLRKRLRSLSRFVQEVKQAFSHWYNAGHERKGYLWGDRFGNQLVEKGDAGLVSSAYIDLNPVRAGLAPTPDDFRWSSMGLRARDKDRARTLLNHLPDFEEQASMDEREAKYRLFVYQQGKIPVPGKAAIDPRIVAEVEALCGRIGISDLVKYRIRNLREGIALGSQDFIASIQKSLGRKHIKPRRVLEDCELYCTRLLS